MPLDTQLAPTRNSRSSARGHSAPMASTRSPAAPSMALTTFAPGQLIGLVLRSPHAHAKIKKIDTSKAEKLAGREGRHHRADLPDHHRR